MAEIFNFTSKSELDAANNLRQFIERCKTELNVFGESLDWVRWRWPKAGNFTKLGANSRTKDVKDKLDDEFIEFAKAYFRYQQGHKPTGTKNELKALRAVEKALLQSMRNASISNISISTLDLAAQLMVESYTGGSAYHGGRELERLAVFLTSKNLVSSDLSNWKNPIPRKRDEIQTGKKAKDRREVKLPAEDALAAMAEIFANNPDDPRDIFTSSLFAMLLCAPSRVSEVLELPVDCEIEQTDSKGVLRYGWRFYSGKGYGADIKWIPTEMVGIAKKAIRRITDLTAESRRLAVHIERGAGSFYRHANCPQVSDDQVLTAIEIQNALGGLVLPKRGGEDTLSKLWQYVLSKQPEGFPWFSEEKGIKFSNALFCMQRNLLHSKRGVSPVILWRPTNNTLNNDLSHRNNVKDHTSIFDRHVYKNADGERLKMTSHQPRHLLNTIAQRGGLSQLQIAKWSGRAEATQNRTYNHMSEYEMVALAEGLDQSLTLFGPSGDVATHIPVTIQEFNTMEKGAVHVTEFGVCVHDYTMSPCEKYRDCLNCSEQVCIKGETDKLGRIKKRLAEVETQYLAAKQAIEDGLAGADRWYEYHENTLGRLRELVIILENPDLPDGAQIKLRNDKAFSPLRRAVESKVSKPKLQNKEEANALMSLTKIIGGGLG